MKDEYLTVVVPVLLTIFEKKTSNSIESPSKKVPPKEINIKLITAIFIYLLFGLHFNRTIIKSIAKPIIPVVEKVVNIPIE